MVLDTITVGISIMILLFYFITLFFLLEIKSRIVGKVGYAFLLLIIGVFLLILRRLEYIFFVSDLITIPYFRDFMSLLFSIFLLLASYIFYKSIIDITNGRRRGFAGSSKNVKIKYNFSDYKRKLRKTVKY
ncbi:MAG: hypothetical protein AABX84_03300 [Nanoarchaeota archaeon]